MNTKKKFLLITSIVLLVVMTCSLFAGCKSAEEKEKEYYEKAAQNVEKCVNTLDTLTSSLLDRHWTASFMYAVTYYRRDSEKKYTDKNKKAENSFVGDFENGVIERGSENQAGWPVKETIKYDKDGNVIGEKDKKTKVDYTISNSTNEYVHFMYFEIDYTDLKNYTVKTTTFEDTDRKTYYNNKDKVKNYAKNFKKIDNLTYEVKDGVASGSLGDDFNPIDYIKANTDAQQLSADGIAASDNFRVYTHFMRLESRQVLDENKNVITRAANDESNKAYWSNYGDDISYNWNNVYNINNNRLTVLYNKGKNQKINQLEIYNEEILSYYTKKDKVNQYLVLKADVVRYHEMVVKFEYK